MEVPAPDDHFAADDCPIQKQLRITLLCGLLQQGQGLGGIGLFQKGGGLPVEDIRSGGHGLRADIKWKTDAAAYGRRYRLRVL